MWSQLKIYLQHSSKQFTSKRVLIEYMKLLESEMQESLKDKVYKQL